MTRVSAPELLLEVQLQEAGIPFLREFVFAPPRKWRADFAFHTRPIAFTLTANRTKQPRNPALLVEIEGGSFTGGHKRGLAYETDTEKASAAAILGYRVIRATPRQVEDGRCLSWIKQALGMEEFDAA